jgi:hypothetical protein
VKAERQEAETIAGAICNLRGNGLRSGGQAFKSVDTNQGKQERRIEIFATFPVFLDSRFVVSSWQKCLRRFEF